MRRLKFSTPDPIPLAAGSGPIIETRRKDPPRPVRKLASVPATPAAEPKPRKPHYPRLPDGAVFHATYSAEVMRWSGTLTIGDLVIEADTGGVMTLMHVLNAKYRAKVKAGEATIPKEAP